MKKKVWMILLAVMLVFGLVMIGCGGGGGGDGCDCSNPDDCDECEGDCEGCECILAGTTVNELVLFEDGEWNTELGTVTVIELNGQDVEVGPLALTGSNYVVSTNGHMATFRFTIPFDASECVALVVEVTETSASQFGYWAGGYVEFYNETGYDDDGETNNYAKYGYWSEGQAELFDQSNNKANFDGTFTFRFSPANVSESFPTPAIPMDKEQFAGFGIKSSQKLTISRVYLSETTVPATAIALNKTTASISEGDTETLTVDFTPAYASNQNVTWATSNAAVATVADGVVTGVSAGTATITVTSVAQPTLTATCQVTVVAAGLVASVTLDKDSAVLILGETLQLTATVLPANAANPSLTWTSSDEDVATVSNTGLVTSVAEGTATIKATSVSDNTKFAECEINVFDVPAGSIYLGDFGIGGGEDQIEWTATEEQIEAIVNGDVTKILFYLDLDNLSNPGGIGGMQAILMTTGNWGWNQADGDWNWIEVANIENPMEIDFSSIVDDLDLDGDDADGGIRILLQGQPDVLTIKAAFLAP